MVGGEVVELVVGDEFEFWVLEIVRLGVVGVDFLVEDVGWVDF